MLSPLSSRRARVAAWGDMIRARAEDANEGKDVSLWSGKSLIIIGAKAADLGQYDASKENSGATKRTDFLEWQPL